MPTAERRQSPRTKPDQLAYLNIEPDNGGIVLNVSEEGLCFHSMAPIQPDGPLRLSLHELNRKIDICGELVWTDDAKKSAGVRFNTLSKEARDRISDWTQQSDSATRVRSTLGAALLKILPATDSRRIARTVNPGIAGWKSGIRVRISGFTRGLAAGFLLALAAFSLLLFAYERRADFGESLIRMGKRLAGNQGADRAPRTAPQQIAAVTPAIVAPAAHPVEARSSVKAASHGVVARVDAEPDDVTVRLLNPPRQTGAASIPGASAQGETHEGSSPATKGPAARAMLSVLPATEPANPSVPQSGTERSALFSKPDPRITSVRSEVAPSLNLSPMELKLQMFFDLGRFKREPLAHELREQLAQIGITSTVVSKRRLWGNSFQVLAGPYDDDEAEKRIHNSLLSHGYKPRPFERGTRDFVFHSRLTIDGSPLPTGNFTVAWESYIGDAKVKFTQRDGLLAAVDGTWVKRSAKFTHDEYVYQLQPDGSRPLLELHFGGMDRALIFRNGQP